MTATGSSADYVDDQKGVNGTSQATLDFVNFVVALNGSGAKEIKFKGDTYEWNTAVRHASKWTKTGATVNNGTTSDTLVTAVVNEVKTQGNNNQTLAAGNVATITITVDGDPLVFVIRIPAAS